MNLTSPDMQTVTLFALLACIAIPIFADFDHIRARRDAVVEASGEGSGESSGEKPAAVVESSGEGSGVEGSGDKVVEASGEASGEGSGAVDALLESSGEGSGDSSSSNGLVASDAAPKDVKALTANEFAVSV